MKNGSLENILEMKRKYPYIPFLNNTQKLICIFGIASGIAYLHSQKILYRDIKPNNTLLDDYLFPKLIDFGLSLNENNVHTKDSNVIGTTPFIAPEIFENGVYSEASDVYAFGILVYEIITSSIPFENLTDGQIMYKVLIKNERPEIFGPIPIIYRKLIESCWLKSPEKRPTFNQIINDLKNQKGFLQNNVDEIHYRSYINFMEVQNNKLFGLFTKYSVKSFIHNHDYNYQVFSVRYNHYFYEEPMPKSESRRYYSIDIPLLNLSHSRSNPLINNLNITEFTKIEQLKNGTYAEIYKIFHKKTSKYYTAKKYKKKCNGKTNPFIQNLKNEIDIISSLNHRSIIKFIGYSKRDFEGLYNIIIIAEYINNNSLKKILEMEQSNIKIPYWNDTMRLIFIYGIASAMSYLHERDIIYRDLKPKNIYMDENLFPKIVDFGKATNNESTNIKNLIQNSIFSAPEIINQNEYTKWSDVYSFSMIVYEIMAKEYPFGNVDHFKMMYDVAFLKKRPTIPSTVPNAYKNLIISCWDHDPLKRLTFNQILYELENNKDFLTQNVDKKLYFAYIQYLKEQSSEISNSLIENNSKLPNQ